MPSCHCRSGWPALSASDVGGTIAALLSGVLGVTGVGALAAKVTGMDLVLLIVGALLFYGAQRME